MSRPRHPNKHIEEAVRYAESCRWEVEMSDGHAWGRLYCPERSREGCRISVWSTPKKPENHARHIRRAVALCLHCGSGADPRTSQEPEDDFEG